MILLGQILLVIGVVGFVCANVALIRTLADRTVDAQKPQRVFRIILWIEAPFMALGLIGFLILRVA